MALFDHGQKLILAANDGQCYFGHKSKRKTHQWSKTELEQINKRAEQDPFSVGGYLKKKISESQSSCDGSIAFDLERISGAARCNKVYAEHNGHVGSVMTFG